MDIRIRREEEKDHRVVEELTREAFWNLYVPGCDEHYLAHILRKHPDFIPHMDFVAELDGKVVGSIMYTKSFVKDENDATIDTITFGPVCVLPEFQGKGTGSALIRHTIGIAKRDKIPAIIILGHPRNYCKHGFRNSIDYNISDRDGRFPFGQLALELETGVFEGNKWKFHYSRAYEIDAAEAERFDALFPEKKKERTASQEEFSIAVRAFLG